MPSSRCGEIICIPGAAAKSDSATRCSESKMKSRNEGKNMKTNIEVMINRQHRKDCLHSGRDSVQGHAMVP
ncbi:hypothetical protein E2C01_037102 [Portunus trituberculatus]|uniref:Uncharacterized protein n=1 Tax=Portunus trituberculatus TaxID=210409 RepID=A0A5B7FEE6_PORTR|nr:hypothetical protein [Portunus trituberculatus]